MSEAYLKNLGDQKKTVESNLNQVIDIIQEDMSGSATRRKYQTFVTGGIGVGVTSSLYQTVYDQDFSLQTANPVVDMTVGLFHHDNGLGMSGIVSNPNTAAKRRDNLVTQGTNYSLNSTTGQLQFDPKSTMMMREKVNIYRQYANYLLGNADAAFSLNATNWPMLDPNRATDNVNSDRTIMDACMFVNVKRLFKRDGIRKETFAMRLYKNAPNWNNGGTLGRPSYSANSPSGTYAYFYGIDGTQVKAGNSGSSFADYQPQMSYTSNIFERSKTNHNASSSEEGVQIIADLGSDTTFKQTATAGDVALLKLASDSNKVVGLLFYQAGIVVLNLGGSSCLSNAAATHDYMNSPGTKIVAGTALDTGLGQDQSTTTHLITPIFECRDPIHGIIAGMDDGVGNEGATANALGAKTTGQVYIGGSYASPHGDNNHVAAGATGDIAANTANGPETTNRATGANAAGARNLGPATFYPDLLVSASIDDIIDHIGYTRFSSGSLTSMAFQNQTKINSSIYFCRASAGEFNFSRNPTFTDASNKAVMLSESDTENTFSYITTVVLADDAGIPVAIAKLNRPIEHTAESEVTIRVRLDF